MSIGVDDMDTMSLGQPSAESGRPERSPVGRQEPLVPRRAGRIAPSAAVLMRPLLVALPIAVFLLPSLLLGLTRQATYTSEARLLLAGFDVQSSALPGFVDASRTLADTYARLVETDVVVQPVAKALGRSRDEVAGHLHASSIADSAIIRVKGSASSEEEAIQLAGAAATALSDYVRNFGGSGDQQLLVDYRVTAKTLAEARVRRDAYQAAYGAAPTAANRQGLADATADYDVANLNAQRAADRYNGVGAGGASLQLVSPPNAATSDRLAKLQLFMAASIFLGLIVGVAFATMVVNRPEVEQRRMAGLGRR